MKSLVIIFCCIVQLGWAQVYTVKGKVTDASTGEALPYATVKIEGQPIGSTTGFDGKYSVKLKEGVYSIKVEAFGFAPFAEELTVTGDVVKDIQLTETINELEEVVITGEAPDKNVSAVEMSVETLEIEEIKKMPAFLGEVDVIKSIQLLPGVTTVGEGASGFNVRGGNQDQNLVLLDDAPIYSSSHLFGFFSIFNSDAVKEIKLYKGGIPAEYGGRLSSVLDITTAEGDREGVHGKGGIGVVSSRFTIGGPINKEKKKGTWQIGARRSYADVFLGLSSDTTISENVAYFYDLNAKGSYKLNDNNKLFFSGYYGRDVFAFGKDFGFDWGNATATTRWAHTFNDSLFSDVSLIYSRYSYKLGVPEGENAFDWRSIIDNFNLHADFKWIKSEKSKVKFGIQMDSYFFNPAIITSPNNESLVAAFNRPKERAIQPNFYGSHEYKLNDKISMEYGVRYSTFFKMGKETVYQYKTGSAKYDSTIVDSTQFSSGEIVKAYHGLEPRFGIKYSLDSVSSIKFSYNRTKQYIHLISNTTGAIPFDVWKSSGEHIQPATADQIAVGYFRNMNKNMYEFSGEVYYKNITDLVDYKDNADLILAPNIETELLTGKGRAYGLELMLRKKKGKTSGWLSYTLAKTERQVDSDIKAERINEGEWYNASYDKRHDITLVMAYEISKRWSVSANFTYAQGRPITLSDGVYEYNGYKYQTYSSRNSSRVPTYHRLDFGATLQGKKNDLRKWKSNWVFSIYNVYRRRNAFSVYTKTEDDGRSQDYQLSILGTMVPAVTYNFEF